MNSPAFVAMLRKDLILYFSNRFFAFITVLGLVFYIGAYFVMPKTVDETIELAFYAPTLPEQLQNQLQEAEGVRVIPFTSAEAVRTAVADGEYEVGVALADDFAAALAAGRPTTARAWFGAGFPDEFKGLYLTFLDELGYLLGGRPLNVQVTEELIGVDRAGQQIPLRDRMLPLFAVLLLVMEMMGLASLIAGEVGSGTLTALLVTPLRVEGLFLAKGVFGAGLAFAQATLLMALTGGLQRQPGLILLALLLGAIMVTGLAFLIASVAGDLMSVMGWSMLGMLLLALPAFSVLVPGITSGWVQALPSWPLVNTVYRVARDGWGWGDAAGQLLALSLWSAAFTAVGVWVLQRRFR